jgi:putative FmdB family regulatory protein
MPLYEYKCDRCGSLFEVIEKFSDKPLEQHEGCGGHVERQLSVSALQFKGTGWYVTDYARNSGSNGKSPAGKSESKDSKESSSKDSKDSKDSSSTKSEPSKPSTSTSSSSSSSSTSTDKK